MSNIFSTQHKDVRVISGGGGSPPDVCVPVTIQTNSLPSGIVGSPYAQYIYANGTAPITFSLISGALPDGLSLNPDTGLISGTVLTPQTSNFRVRAVNLCPSQDERNYTVVTYIAPFTIRWGNYPWPNGTGSIPSFVEADFVGGSPTVLDLQNLASATRVGSYNFPFRDSCHNVIWIAASLLTGSPQFKTGGDPWGMYPGWNLALQALTIAGIPGYVFYSAYWNGDYYLDVT